MASVAQALINPSGATRPFVWGADGEAVTKEMLDRRRKMADALRAPAGYQPKGVWSTLGALAGEGVATFKDKQADTTESAAQQAVKDALAKKDYLGVMGNDFATPQQGAVSSALLGRQWGQEDDAREAAQRASERAAAIAAQRSDPAYQLDLQLKQAQLAKANAPEHDPLINAGGGQIYDPNQGKWISNPDAPAGGGVDFSDIAGVRKEVQSLPSFKNYSQALPIYNAMKETAGRDSRASDLNLVYGLGKIMDPTSVVREGEMVMVKDTASLPDWLIGTINSLNGGAALTGDTRKAIMTEAYGRMSGYQDAFGQDAAGYRGMADRYQINPDDILPKYDAVSPWAADPAPGSPAAGGAAPPASYQGDPNLWQYMTPEQQALWQ